MKKQTAKHKWVKSAFPLVRFSVRRSGDPRGELLEGEAEVYYYQGTHDKLGAGALIRFKDHALARETMCSFSGGVGAAILKAMGSDGRRFKNATLSIENVDVGAPFGRCDTRISDRSAKDYALLFYRK